MPQLGQPKGMNHLRQTNQHHAPSLVAVSCASGLEPDEPMALEFDSVEQTRVVVLVLCAIN